MVANNSTQSVAHQIEVLDRSRRQMLASVVVTSVLWFLPQIVQGLWAGSLPPVLNKVLIVAGLAGAGVWMAAMWRYHRFQQKVQADPELRRRLDDERVIALRKEAILRGWGILLAALTVGVALAPFVELPDVPVMLILLLVGVNAPILIFLILDRG
jgi:hypothetical protein